MGNRRDLDRNLAGTGESWTLDPGTGTYVSESWDRLLNRDLDRELDGLELRRVTSTAAEWKQKILEPGPSLDLGSSLEPGPSQLGWNRNSKGRMRKFVETFSAWLEPGPPKSSETRERSWILLGDRPPVYPSVLRMGTFSRRVKHRSFTWAPDWSRWPPAPEKTGVKMWEPVSGLPEGEIRGELEGSHPCRVQKQKILEGGREGSGTRAASRNRR